MTQFYIAVPIDGGKYKILDNEFCEVASNTLAVANRQLPAGAKFTIVSDEGRKAILETGKLPKGHEIFESMGIHPVEEFLASRAMSADRTYPWKPGAKIARGIQ